MKSWNACRASVLLTAATLALLASASAATADQRQAEKYLEDAKKSLDKGDPKAALIQLKNAVQADPTNGLARLQLGVVELRLGDYLGAEKELQTALERNVEHDKVDGPLAETLLRLNKNKELLDTLKEGTRSPDVEASVRMARGYAHLTLQQLPDAEKSFNDAITLSTKPSLAQLGLARVDAAEGKITEAVAATMKALEIDPKLSDGWTFLSQLHRSQGDNAAARTDVDKAIELNPGNALARLYRATLLITTDDLAGAEADVKAVLRTAPKSPVANYVEAQIQVRQKNLRGAETTLQSIRNLAPDYTPAMYMLAAVNLALGEREQAEDNVNRFLSRVPNHEAGTALLASILVERGNLQRAIEVLKAASDANPKSVRLLSLLSDAYQRNKQPEQAAAALSQITATNPDDADLRTRVAGQRLRLGRTEEAVADLETATELAPKSTQAGLMLVLSLMQEKKIDEAVKAAQDLQARTPDDPVSENLVGALFVQKGDLDGARHHFEAALKLKPDFTPAEMNLGSVAVAQNKPDDARAAFNRVLARDPKDVTALTAMADLSLREGKPADAIADFETARQGNPQAIPPRLRLIELYLANKDTAKASAVAAETQLLGPDNPQVLSVAGQARLANNEPQAALDAFQKLAAVAPNSGEAWLLLARTHYTLKDNDAARGDLEKAAQLAPTDQNVGQQFARFAIETDSVAKELAFLNGLAGQKPDDPAYDLFTGDLLIAAGKPADAATAYQKGLAKKPDSPAAITKLAQAQSATDPSKGIATLQEWLKQHPDQTGVRFVDASMLLAAKRYDESITEHEAVIKVQPDNIIAENNLAWLYQLKKDDRALPMAERAHQQNPNNGDVSDTLAWILVQHGENAKAIDILEKLATVPAAPPEIRYHLAVALKNSGRPQDARQALAEALKGDKPFEGKSDAEALMKELSGG